MDDRTCNLCLKVFDKPSNLKRHQNRKIPCRLTNGENQNQCIYCKKSYSRNDVLKKHSRICSQKKNIDDTAKVKLLEEELKNKDIIINKMVKNKTITNSPTKVTTEKSTNKSTEKSTEKSTNKSTEKSTNKSTEKSTNKSTEKIKPQSEQDKSTIKLQNNSAEHIKIAATNADAITNNTDNSTNNTTNTDNSTNNTKTIDNSVANNINVTINYSNYNTPKLDGIKLSEDIIEQLSNPITLGLIKLIYFNKKVPENHVILCENEKDLTLRIDDEWQKITGETEVADRVNNIVDIVRKFMVDQYKNGQIPSTFRTMPPEYVKMFEAMGAGQICNSDISLTMKKVIQTIMDSNYIVKDTLSGPKDITLRPFNDPDLSNIALTEAVFLEDTWTPPIMILIKLVYFNRKIPTNNVIICESANDYKYKIFTRDGWINIAGREQFGEIFHIVKKILYKFTIAKIANITDNYTKMLLKEMSEGFVMLDAGYSLMDVSRDLYKYQ